MVNNTLDIQNNHISLTLKKKKMKKTFTLVAALCGLMAAKAQKPFTPGNIVIYKVGDSTTKLSATKVFPVTLEEHSIANVLITKKAPVVNSVSLPSRTGTATGNNHLLSASGSTTTEGQMTRSADGNYLVFAGYDAGADTSTVGFTNLSSSTDRIIGTVDKNGTVNTTTIISRNITNTVTKGLFTGLSPRSVVSTDGSHFYFILSNAGIYSETLGDSSSVKKISQYSKSKAPGGSPTARSLEIYDNTLYSSYQSTYIPTNKVGDQVQDVALGSLGSATAPDTFVTTLAGIDTIYKSATKVTRTSPYQFLMLTLTGGKVLYIADDATNGAITERGIQKYSLVSGTWVYNGSIYASGVRSITGTNQGDTVAIFATSSKNLYGTVDLGGFNKKPTLPPLQDSAIILDTAVANTAFRGVAFAPGIPSIPTPVALKSSLTASVINGSAVLSWSTATEVNQKSFGIEKSLDGKTFTALKTVNANNKPSSYSYTDPSTLNAVQYYRLKMIGTDGKFTYSGVASVTNKVSIRIGVSPNPVTNNATISHSLATAGSVLKITSFTGKIVATYPVQAGATQTSVDVAHLTSGTYIVSFVNGSSTTTAKFVK